MKRHVINQVHQILLKLYIKKINQCAVFIADISPVTFLDDGKQIPNPNVLLEEGFALRCLGSERIILISNNDAQGLPFDIAQRRITNINLDLTGPLRMALLAAQNVTLNEYQRNSLDHDSNVYIKFTEIIGSEHTLLDILSSIHTNLRISKFNYSILDKIIKWHEYGDGKYINSDINVNVVVFTLSISKLLELIDSSIVDTLYQGHLPLDNFTEEDIKESNKHDYWYFKKLYSDYSPLDDERVLRAQNELLKSSGEVKQAYIKYRDSVRNNLFL